jgi:hypothetical protein
VTIDVVDRPGIPEPASGCSVGLFLFASFKYLFEYITQSFIWNIVGVAVMFKGISRAKVDGAKLLLSRNGRQVDDKLDGTVFHLRGTSTELIARTVTEFESAWRVGEEKVSADLYVKHTNYIDIPTLRPVSVSEKGRTRFTVSARMSLGADRVYGFQGDQFLGQAELILLHIASADETRAAVGFHGRNDEANQAASLNISIHLEQEVFQATFKPLWLGNQTAAVDVVVGVCGFTRGPESSSRDAADPQSFVMASGVWSAELRSVVLSTTCSSLERH